MIDILLICAKWGLGIAFGACVSVLALVAAYFISGALVVFAVWVSQGVLRRW